MGTGSRECVDADHSNAERLQRLGHRHRMPVQVSLRVRNEHDLPDADEGLLQHSERVVQVTIGAGCVAVRQQRQPRVGPGGAHGQVFPGW